MVAGCFLPVVGGAENAKEPALGAGSLMLSLNLAVRRDPEMMS
jgi:hypothetical protein